MKARILGLLAVAMLAEPIAANALTWNWTYSGYFTSEGTPAMLGGGGTFTTNGLSGGSYLITDITGTYEGDTITALLPPYPDATSFALNSNLLFDGPDQLDSGGFSFTSGGRSINFYRTQEYIVIDQNIGTTADAFVSFNATQVPEPVPLPAAAWLLISGLGGLGLLGKRRKY